MVYLVVHTRRRMPTRQITTYWRYNLGVLIPYRYDEMIDDMRNDIDMRIRACTDDEYKEIMRIATAEGENGTNG